MNRVFLFASILTLAITSHFFAISAQACSIAPLNPAIEAQDLQRFIPPALNIDKEAILSIYERDVSADYIWSDSLLCPIGKTAKATFIVRVSNPSDRLTSGCTGTVTISKTEPWGARSEPPVKTVYSTEIVRSTICLE